MITQKAYGSGSVTFREDTDKQTIDAIVKDWPEKEKYGIDVIVDDYGTITLEFLFLPQTWNKTGFEKVLEKLEPYTKSGRCRLTTKDYAWIYQYYPDNINRWLCYCEKALSTWVLDEAID